MERREFLTALPSLAWLWAGKPPLPEPPLPEPPLPEPPLPEPPRRTLLQTCTVAGFQYYAGPQIWKEMAPGDSLHLVREPWNVHDRNAVALFWKDRKIGYLPRHENALAASLLDQGKTVCGAVAARGDVREPWGCLQVAVWMEE
jgi:hypothetical protein